MRVFSAPKTIFCAAVNAPISSKCCCTMPIPKRMASAGEEKARLRRPIHQNRARVRFEQAKQHLHQRGFSGPVFAHDGMTRTGRKGKGHVLQGHHRPKRNQYIFQINGGSKIGRASRHYRRVYGKELSTRARLYASVPCFQEQISGRIRGAMGAVMTKWRR